MNFGIKGSCDILQAPAPPDLRGLLHLIAFAFHRSCPNVNLLCSQNSLTFRCVKNKQHNACLPFPTSTFAAAAPAAFAHSAVLFRSKTFFWSFSILSFNLFPPFLFVPYYFWTSCWMLNSSNQFSVL